MAKTYTELLQGAQKIKENELPESNTHDLVGEQLVQMVNRASEDKAALDKTLTEHQEQFDNLQNDIDGNTEAINDEKNRAEAAEKANAAAIVAEKNRAEAAEKANADAIAAEKIRAEAAEKANAVGIGIIRGDSHLTPSGTDSTYTLTMIIGRGTPVKVDLPVHGIEEWDVPADTPALIDPWAFQELMGLFLTIENESKARSDADESLNASVKSLLQHVAKLTMAITPSVVFRSSVDTTEIAVSASMTVVTPDRLELLQGTDELAAVENTSSASSAATITPTNNVQFAAKAVVGELEFETKATLQVVDPVYAGAGAAHTDIILDENKQTVRTNAAGTYNVTVANDGDYVWLLVPRSFAAIKKATLSGFDFPLETPTVIYIGGSSALTGGIPYSCYRSSNQYAAGNLSIVIS